MIRHKSDCLSHRPLFNNLFQRFSPLSTPLSPIGAVVLTALTLFTTGCNLYSIVSTPAGNEQTLSLARACFDRGDIPCAKEYYSKLTGSYKDTAAAEEALVVLKGSGVGMLEFAGAILGGVEKGLSNLATTLSKEGASEELRLELFEAYRDASDIEDEDLRAFIRFMTAFALTAELLAEEAGGDAFTQDDLADDAEACLAASEDNVCFETACTKASPGLLATNEEVDLDAAETDLSGEQGTFAMLLGAINAVGAATSELTGSGSSGGLGSSASSFSGAFDAAEEFGCLENYYRKTLLDQGIGK